MPAELGNAAVIMVVAPEGVPLVRELTKPRPIYWKLPAGKCDSTETIGECAARELEEETGIRLPQEALVLVTSEDRRNHVLHVFGAKLPFLPELKIRGDEDERIKVFPIEEIRQLIDFHPDHRRIVEMVLAALS